MKEKHSVVLRSFFMINFLFIFLPTFVAAENEDFSNSLGDLEALYGNIPEQKAPEKVITKEALEDKTSNLQDSPDELNPEDLSKNLESENLEEGNASKPTKDSLEEVEKKEANSSNVILDTEGNVLKDSDGNPITTDAATDSLDQIAKGLDDDSEDVQKQTLMQIKAILDANKKTAAAEKTNATANQPVNISNPDEKKGLTPLEIGLIVSSSLTGAIMIGALGALVGRHVVKKMAPSDEKVRADLISFDDAIRTLKDALSKEHVEQGFLEETKALEEGYKGLTENSTATAKVKFKTILSTIDSLTQQGYFKDGDDSSKENLSARRAVMVRLTKQLVEVNNELLKLPTTPQSLQKTLRVVNTNLKTISTRAIKSANLAVVNQVIGQEEKKKVTPPAGKQFRLTLSKKPIKLPPLRPITTARLPLAIPRVTLPVQTEVGAGQKKQSISGEKATSTSFEVRELPRSIRPSLPRPTSPTRRTSTDSHFTSQ